MPLMVQLDLDENPKTIALAQTLGVAPKAAVGYLVPLWLWALRRGPVGDVPSAAMAAYAAGWPGDPARFWDAMRAQEHRFLDDNPDGSCTIHDWAAHSAAHFAAIAPPDAAKLRQRRQINQDTPILALVRDRDGTACRLCGVRVDFSDRRGARGGSYARLDPAISRDPANVIVACRGCVVALDGHSPAEAGIAVRPAPASTLIRPGLARQLLDRLGTIPNWGVPQDGDLRWLDGILDQFVTGHPERDPVLEVENLCARTSAIRANRRGLVERWFANASAFPPPEQRHAAVRRPAAPAPTPDPAPAYDPFDPPDDIPGHEVARTRITDDYIPAPYIR